MYCKQREYALALIISKIVWRPSTKGYPGLSPDLTSSKFGVVSLLKPALDGRPPLLLFLIVRLNVFVLKCVCCAIWLWIVGLYYGTSCACSRFGISEINIRGSTYPWLLLSRSGFHWCFLLLRYFRSKVKLV